MSLSSNSESSDIAPQDKSEDSTEGRKLRNVRREVIDYSYSFCVVKEVREILNLLESFRTPSSVITDSLSDITVL